MLIPAVIAACDLKCSDLGSVGSQTKGQAEGSEREGRGGLRGSGAQLCTAWPWAGASLVTSECEGWEHGRAKSGVQWS